jgi:hypothetical protein
MHVAPFLLHDMRLQILHSGAQRRRPNSILLLNASGTAIIILFSYPTAILGTISGLDLPKSLKRCLPPSLVMAGYFIVFNLPVSVYSPCADDGVRDMYNDTFCYNKNNMYWHYAEFRD